MIIINDLHLNARRKAGATPTSQEALRAYIFKMFNDLVTGTEGRLIILGDLFDSFDVDARDIIATFNVLNFWLGNEENHLTLVMGNHDASAKGSKLSSFHLLAHMLCSKYKNIRVVSHEDGLTLIDDDIYVISHQLNQELFDLELSRACLMQGGVLLLHANCNNFFAQQSDHSLNVSEQQITNLLAAGWKLIFAHEHDHRVLYNGHVVIIGNQIPTSISDLLGHPVKYALQLDGRDHTLLPVLNVPDVFARVDWHDLDEAPDKPFLRVEGAATASEATEMVNAVAKFRQKSNALVITNAVRVDGMAEFDAIAEISLEQVTSFSVLDALLEELEPREREVVKELLEC